MQNTTVNDLARAVVGIWALSALFAWVGVVRHAYRAYRARVDRNALTPIERKGWLGWAADSHLIAEHCRLAVKGGLLVFAMLTLWRQLDRAATLDPILDTRDLIAPLVFLLALVLLTHWSNLDLARRPVRRQRHRMRAAERA